MLSIAIMFMVCNVNIYTFDFVDSEISLNIMLEARRVVYSWARCWNSGSRVCNDHKHPALLHEEGYCHVTRSTYL